MGQQMRAAPDGSVSPDASSASARRTERSVSRAASPTKRNDPKDVVEQFFDAYRKLDVDGIVDLLSVDIIFEDPTFRLREVGRDGIRRMATEVRATYSGVAIDVHSMLVSGDAVAAEVTMSWVVARWHAPYQGARRVVLSRPRRPDLPLD
jgi:ketosteroid isomerase-like protein